MSARLRLPRRGLAARLRPPRRGLAARLRPPRRGLAARLRRRHRLANGNGGAAPAGSPFRALGLQARPDLTDDEVRAAWRRIAAACHPDRADGGDPDQFAAAAAAYTVLRTRFGRGEALADLHAAGPGAGRRLAGRIRRGRPWRLGLRALAAAAAIALAVVVAGSQPAALALVTGVLTWLVLTARHDLDRVPQIFGGADQE
jgi:hypothetical protein